MFPHTLAKAFLLQRMMQWRFARVKSFENSLFLTHSVLVFVSFVLGVFAYNAGALMNSIPSGGFFSQMALIFLYCYLFYWSIIGFMCSILLTIWSIMWLIRCPARRRRRREEAERLLRGEGENMAGDRILAPEH